MLKESPQAHSCVACGFTIFSPPPRSASLNSSVEPSTIGALRRSTRTRTPSAAADHVVLRRPGVGERQLVGEAGAPAGGHPDAEDRRPRGPPWRRAAAILRAASSVTVITSAVVLHVHQDTPRRGHGRSARRRKAPFTLSDTWREPEATSEPVPPPPITKTSNRSITNLEEPRRTSARRRAPRPRARRPRPTRSRYGRPRASPARGSPSGCPLVDVEAGVGDAGEPGVGGGRPSRARDGGPAEPAIAGSPLTSAASVHSLSANDRSTSGCSVRIVGREPVERREHLLGVRLAGDDPAIDVDDAAVGHDVGGAARPRSCAAFTVGRPTSGCSRSGSTSASRSRNRAIEVIAFTPRCGVEPWAALPRAVAVIQAPPRSARASSRSVGSPTIAASWSRKPRSHRTLVP